MPLRPRFAAAQAYDREAIKQQGVSAVTNFGRHQRWMEFKPCFAPSALCGPLLPALLLPVDELPTWVCLSADGFLCHLSRLMRFVAGAAISEYQDLVDSLADGSDISDERGRPRHPLVGACVPVSPLDVCICVCIMFEQAPFLFSTAEINALSPPSVCLDI